MRLQIHIITIILIIFSSQITIAGGTNFLSIFGARTLARNGLYIAGADGLTCTNVNPAGLLYVDSRGVEFAVINRVNEQRYSDPVQGPFRSFRDNSFSFAGGIYWNLSSHLAAAVAYHRPVDYQVNWPYALFLGSGMSYSLLAFDMYNRVQVDAISPSVAFRIGAIGIGLTANAYYVQHHLAFPITNDEWSAGRGMAAYQFEYKQDAWTFGLTLGIMLPLAENLRVGFVTRNSYRATLEGKAKSKIFAEIDSVASQANITEDLEMPWSIGLGLVFHPRSHWEINLDVATNLWSSTRDKLDFKFDQSGWEARVTKVDSITGIRPGSLAMGFKNCIDLGVGVEYSPPKGLAYRVGYRFSQSPNSDESYSMFFPSVHQHWLSMGLGYKSENYVIDAGLAYAIGILKEISSTEGGKSSKQFDSASFIPAVNFRYSF